MEKLEKNSSTAATNSEQVKLKSRRRLRLLIVALIAIAISALGYVEFFARRPIGQGPAGPLVNGDSFENVWTEREVVLVGIGDSVTAGLGAKNKSHSYFERLCANPTDEWPEMQGKSLTAVLPKLRSLNIAVSGSTSLQHVDFIEHKVPQYPQDQFGIVVMTTGGNDLIHSYGRLPPKEGGMYGATLEQAEPWIANFEARLNSMLDEIIGRFPGGCEIYLADIYDPTDGVGDALSIYLPKWRDGIKIHACYNQVIRQCAERFPQVHLVPLYEIFLGHGSHCRQFWRATYDKHDPHFWFFDNIEDPNDRGYDAIRRVFLNTIVQNCSLRPDKSNK